MGGGASGMAVSPAHRAAEASRPAIARQAPHPPAAPRHAGGQRPAAPDLWNPLKRKRMAMPPPPQPGDVYAF